MTLVPRRVRLGSLLAVALGALALIALPGVAAAQRGDHSNGRENAGTITSFDEESGALTIELREGGSVTALVGDETRILCVGPRGRRNGHEHHHHRGHGKGHEGEESGEEASAPPRRERRQDRRRGRGHHCTTDALVEGAIVRKAQIETVEETEAFETIMVSKPRPANAANAANDAGPKQGCDGHGEGASEEGDDEGGDEEGPIST